VYAPYTALAAPAGDLLPDHLIPPVTTGSYTLGLGDPNHIAVFEVKPDEVGRITTLTVGTAGPEGGVGIAVNPTTGNIFVSNSAENSLTVIKGDTLYSPATLPMPGDPGDVAVNPLSNRVYVSNRSAHLVRMVTDVY